MHHYHSWWRACQGCTCRRHCSKIGSGPYGVRRWRSIRSQWRIHISNIVWCTIRSPCHEPCWEYNHSIQSMEPINTTRLSIWIQACEQAVVDVLELTARSTNSIAKYWGENQCLRHATTNNLAWDSVVHPQKMWADSNIHVHTDHFDCWRTYFHTTCLSGFQPEQNETEYLKQRLRQEKAKFLKAEKARKEAEARCLAAERERVSLHVVHSYQDNSFMPNTKSPFSQSIGYWLFVVSHDFCVVMKAETFSSKMPQKNFSIY